MIDKHIKKLFLKKIFIVVKIIFYILMTKVIFSGAISGVTSVFILLIGAILLIDDLIESISIFKKKYAKKS